MNSAKSRPIFLSPHLDDAVLSCGGLIHQHAERGLRPLVVTLFAGIPDSTGLSPFAAELHRQWGHPVAASMHRRLEDTAALAHLGAEHQHWDYMDCIYRQRPNGREHPYASFSDLFGQVNDADHSLEVELATRLSDLALREPSHFYVPLAVGHHVDHQLVRSVAFHHGANLGPVYCFEDYPYAQQSEALALALDEWAVPPAAHVRLLTQGDLDARISAIHFYRSQLGVLFGDGSAVESHVKSYALCVGGGARYAERYWRGGSIRARAPSGQNT